MYICRIVSTIDVNEYTFCINEQQKVYYAFYSLDIKKLDVILSQAFAIFLR